MNFVQTLPNVATLLFSLKFCNFRLLLALTVLWSWHFMVNCTSVSSFNFNNKPDHFVHKRGMQVCKGLSSSYQILLNHVQ